MKVKEIVKIKNGKKVKSYDLTDSFLYEYVSKGIIDFELEIEHLTYLVHEFIRNGRKQAYMDDELFDLKLSDLRRELKEFKLIQFKLFKLSRILKSCKSKRSFKNAFNISSYLNKNRDFGFAKAHIDEVSEILDFEIEELTELSDKLYN